MRACVRVIVAAARDGVTPLLSEYNECNADKAIKHSVISLVVVVVV